MEATVPTSSHRVICGMASWPGRMRGLNGHLAAPTKVPAGLPTRAQDSCRPEPEKPGIGGGRRWMETPVKEEVYYCNTQCSNSSTHQLKVSPGIRKDVKIVLFPPWSQKNYFQKQRGWISVLFCFLTCKQLTCFISSPWIQSVNQPIYQIRECDYKTHSF